MVGISKALSADNVKRYHRQSHMLARAYYTENATLHGIWVGEIAKTFGLDGQQVQAIHFDRLAEGKHPITGEQLIKVRPIKQEKSPDWVKDNEAWRKHVEHIVGAAMDPFSKTYVGNPFADGFEPGKVDAPARRTPKKDIPAPKWDEKQKQLIAMHEEAAQIYRENLAGPAGREVREYLEKRGFTMEMLGEFGVGLSVSHAQLSQRFAGRYSQDLMKDSGLFVRRGEKLVDRFRSRIMFPIQSSVGETIAFGARRYDGKDHAKYINSEKTAIYDKSATLYNLHRAKGPARAEGRTVGVEGYLDVIAAHHAGVTNVVATCGTSLTKKQAGVLRNLGSDVLLNFDGDEAGRKATVRHASTLINAGLTVSCLNFENGEDPAGICAKPDGPEFYRLRIKHTADSLLEWGFNSTKRAIEEREDKSNYYRTSDEAKKFLQMFDGIEPEKRERVARDLAQYLRQPVEKKKHKFLARRAAWDIVFSPDKSVSLAALTGGDERLIEAHRRSVERAAKFIESMVQAKMGNTNPAEHTGKFIAACFDHDSSRAVDGYEAAQLHTHMVMFNMTEMPSGRTRAMETAWIFETRELAKAKYQMSMRHEIRELGYKLKTGKNRAPAIAGFSKEYLASESKRAKKINEAAEEKGLVGAASRALLAHAEREKKHEKTPEERRALHRANGEQFGHEADRIVAESIENQRVIEITPERREQIARKAVTYARKSLGHHNSILETHQILTKALYRGNGYIGIEDAEEEIARQAAAGQLIEVSHGRKDAPGPRYTTPELVQDARIAIEVMRTGLDACEPLGKMPDVEGLIDGQREAVEYFVQSRDQVFGFRGKAGSGKTYVVRKMDEAARSAGYITRGMGPTGQAQTGLADAGIESETIQAYVMRSKDDRDPRPRWYFLDEASMIDGHDMREFMARLRPQDRSTIIYDHQHESVGSGRIYKDLAEAGMPTVGLHEIIRQRKNPELLKAAQVISDGNVNLGLALLSEQNRITTIEHRVQRFLEMARDYALDPDGCLVICPDNLSRKELSEVIRKQLQVRGQLEKEEWTARILVGKRDTNKEDVEVAGSYEEDDVLRYRKGSKALKINAGDRAKVLDVNEEANTITVKMEGSGREITYNPENLHGVEVYRVDKADFAVHDRVQFTRGNDKLSVVNRQTGTITFLDRAGNCRVELDRGGHEVSFNLRQMPYIDHAYVMTSYSAQGATVRRVVAHMDTGDTRLRNLLNQTTFYVTATRGEMDLQIYTDGDVPKLAKALNRQVQNESALSPPQKLAYRQGQGMVA